MAILTALPCEAPVPAPIATSTAQVVLTIPLDHNPEAIDTTADAEDVQARRKPILRRDSMKRREALLKGKEGSRRRHRWENGKYYLP